MAGFTGWQEEAPPAGAEIWSSGSLSQGHHPRTVVILMALAAGIAFAAGMRTARTDPARTSWDRVTLYGRRVVGHRTKSQHSQPGMEPTPAMLRRLLVMITFHFDPAHLAWLAQARISVNNPWWRRAAQCSMAVCYPFRLLMGLARGAVAPHLVVCPVYPVQPQQSAIAQIQSGVGGHGLVCCMRPGHRQHSVIPHGD